MLFRSGAGHETALPQGHGGTWPVLRGPCGAAAVAREAFCYKGMIMIAEENIKLKMDISSVIHKKCVIYFMKRLWITVV